ncbi:hypothetical protein JIG36_04130 [Actinoplanes sp. LDG1-06]|uniref:Uncharacterized protein n=1 Tax=Paractinoplanes ovalisporus TaxID=2810368 RepID=A0ABS2A4G3_9ACTN|nr:hypothetical protein [Actinoplanes ovalisporus]MBM2614742.1 hypothetical protein [Actinoplanes ovalisporus]
MRIDELRAGWPEQLLTGQYTIRISGGTIGGEILDDLGKLFTLGLHEPGNDTQVQVIAGGTPVMTFRRDEGDGIRAVADWPLLTLVEISGSRRPPGLLRQIFDPLTGTSLTWRSRLRTATRRARRARPVVPVVWDVHDNRLGRVIGRLTTPVGAPPGTLTVLLGEDGHPAAFLMDDPGRRVPPRSLTFLSGGHPAAQVTRIRRGYQVDVAAAAAAGLDPRLVLAGVMLQFAHLSTR